MFLRNKLAILSFTLMSLMTIPTLAENDAPSVNSRIENTNFDVQIKTPEGWSETKDFTHAIPETFQLNGLTFRGTQFKNGTENHGCAVFFAENDDKNDDEDGDFSVLEKTLNQAQELAFPGSKASKITFTKVSVDGSLGADFISDTTKVELKGTIEASLSKETGDPSKFTISGALRADSTKGNFAIGTGQIVAEGTMPYNGTTAVQLGTDYQIIILMWGTDEATQLRDALRFLEAVTVKARTPEEPIVSIVVIAEPIAVIIEEITQATPDASESVVAADETAPAAPASSEPVAAQEAVPATPVAVETAPAAPATSEPVAAAEEVVPAAPIAAEPVAATEEAAPATPVAVEAVPTAAATTEAVVAVEEVVQATPETPAA